MSTHNMCFYGELTKIILQLSQNTLFICSTGFCHFVLVEGFGLYAAGSTFVWYKNVRLKKSEQVKTV